MNLKKRSLKTWQEFGLTILLVMVLTGFTFLVKNLSSENTRLYSKAAGSVILSDGFTSLSSWTPTGVNTSIGQVATPGYSIGGKSGVKLTMNGGGALCLTRNITPSSDIRVHVEFYDDYNTANPAASNTSGSFIALRNSHSANLSEIMAGVHNGKYVQTINGKLKDFYFLRLGYNSYPSGSGIDPDSSSFVARSSGWHSFDLVNTAYGSYAEIDGVNTSYLPAINGTSKGYTNRVGLADQILLCNTWINGSSYYANLIVYTPAVPAFPGSVAALYNPIVNYLNQYPAPDASNKNQFPYIGNYSDWYTRAGLCRLYADDAAASAVAWKKYANSGWKVRALNSLTKALDLENCYPLWQAGVIDYNVQTFPVQLAVWYLWNDLSPQLKQSSRSIIANELNFFTTFAPANRWQNDSAAEENSWIAQDLWIGANLFSNHPNASLWRSKAEIYANWSLSGGTENPPVGHTLEYPGYYVQNHNVRNNHYQLLALGQLGNIFLLADRLGISQPNISTYGHNISNVWSAVKDSLSGLSYINNPPNVWPLPVTRGNKDEHGLDPYYQINTLYFLQKHGLGGSVFDDTMRLGWYMYNDTTVMPAAGSNFMNYASDPGVWRYPLSVDCGYNGFINDFRRWVYNSVAAGERFSFTAAVADTSLQLPPRLDNSAVFYPPSGIYADTAGTSSNNITGFIQATGINHYIKYHFDAHPAVDLISWTDNLADGHTLRINFYDDPSKNSGMNFGWLTTGKASGLSFQIKTGDPVASCSKSWLRGALFTTQCYIVRTNANSPSSEISTSLARTNGWHYVDFMKSGNTYTMNFDGLRSYNMTTLDSLNYFFIASGNWSIPTVSDFVVTKL